MWGGRAVSRKKWLQTVVCSDIYHQLLTRKFQVKVWGGRAVSGRSGVRQGVEGYLAYSSNIIGCSVLEIVPEHGMLLDLPSRDCLLPFRLSTGTQEGDLPASCPCRTGAGKLFVNPSSDPDQLELSDLSSAKLLSCFVRISCARSASDQ